MIKFSPLSPCPPCLIFKLITKATSKGGIYRKPANNDRPQLIANSRSFIVTVVVQTALYQVHEYIQTQSVLTLHHQ